MSIYHQKMMMPYIMEMFKTVRLSHKMRLAKNMLQDETSSIDKASSHDEAASQDEAVVLHSTFLFLAYHS